MKVTGRNAKFRADATNLYVRTHGDGDGGHPADAAYEFDRAVAPACDELAVLCWCGRSSVWVPQRLAGFGTLSCGSRKCFDPTTGVAGAIGERVPHGNKGRR